MGANTFLKKQINCKKIQKVASVIKKIYFVVFLLCTSVYSQQELEGIYGYLDMTGEYWEGLEFYKDNVFYYESGADLGVSKYGKGHYTLTKDSLFLNYDLTEIKYSGYHILKPYTSLKDLVNINVKVYDTDKNILPNTSVFMKVQEEWHSAITDSLGMAQLQFKRDKSYSKLDFINNEHFAMYCIENMWLGNSYEIEVFLARDTQYAGYAIKNTIHKYKILKHKKNYLRLKRTDGLILRLNKLENMD